MMFEEPARNFPLDPSAVWLTVHGPAKLSGAAPPALFDADGTRGMAGSAC